MRGPCACPSYLLDPQGGQAQGPPTSAPPPLVPTTNPTETCVGTRCGVWRMWGPCACPRPVGLPTRRPCACPRPVGLPTYEHPAYHRNRPLPQDKHKAPTYPFHHPLSLRQTLTLT